MRTGPDAARRARAGETFFDLFIFIVILHEG
jgi:hypothetical protein